jgi:hypothetical protein
MKTYLVTTYQDSARYTVTIDKTGVVSATELSDAAIEQLKTSVKRLMDRYNISSVAALDRVVGSYSSIREQKDDSVAEDASEDVVS